MKAGWLQGHNGAGSGAVGGGSGAGATEEEEGVKEENVMKAHDGIEYGMGYGMEAPCGFETVCVVVQSVCRTQPTSVPCPPS